MLDMPEQGTALSAPPAAPSAGATGATDTIVLSELYEVAFLLTRRHPLISVRANGDGPPRVLFAFKAEAADDVRAYQRGDLVSARAYANAIRHVKRLIHNPHLTDHYLGGPR